MKVGAIQPYVATVYGVTSPPSPSTPTPPKVAEQIQTPQLSAAERELFIRLFPESAPYIAHHVLFTRDAHLSEADIHKGTLIDVRV